MKRTLATLAAAALALGLALTAPIDVSGGADSLTGGTGCCRQ